MIDTFATKKSSVLYRLLSSKWFAPAVYLLVVRILLNIIVLAVSNMLPVLVNHHFATPISFSPFTIPGIWVRYDAGYYINLAMQGYSYRGADVNFLPVYPSLIRVFSLGSGFLTGAWSGFLLSNAAFLLAAMLLWDQVRAEINENVAWNTLITLSIFPTAFFFSAVYTESVFLLFSLLVYRFARQGRYLPSAVMVALASLTRITGILLVLIPLIEIFRREKRQPWKTALLALSISGAGLGLFMIFTWYRQGSPLAFIEVQKSTMGRYIAAPWTTLADSLGVIVTGAGINPSDWFMRTITLHDLAYILLFLFLGILSLRWLPKSQSIYLLAALLMITTSHGPVAFGVYSGSRYVLTLFPGFVVLGILLEKHEQYKSLVWTASVMLCLLLACWWVTGHWVA